MNMRSKFFTAFLLTLAMAVSGAYVFAGTEAQSSDENIQAAIDVTEEAVLPEEGSSDAMLIDEPDVVLDAEDEGDGISVMAVDGEILTITAKTLTYKSTKKPDWGDYNYPGNSGGCSILKVKVKTSGKLWFDVQEVGSNTSGAKVYVGKYDASTGTVDYTNTTSTWIYSGSDPKVGFGGLDVTSKGSYCIGIESTNPGAIVLRTYVYSYATRDLPAGKFKLAEGYKTASDGSYKDSYAKFKIKPSKTGYIRVYGKEYGYSTSAGDITLLNSKKKAVSDKVWLYDGSSPNYVAFGVKKGKTYYLKMSGFTGSYDDQFVYGIKYKGYAAKLRSNTSKKKATNLKRKAKYISSAMPATGSTGSQWYKFKVTKKRATQVKIDATNIMSGTTEATFYCGKKKIGTSTLSKGKINTCNITYSTTYGKAKKGTYYIKIHKSKKANGQYKIKYVK